MNILDKIIEQKKVEVAKLPARIIAVADLYDAMTSDRPYRKGLPAEVAIDEMNRVAGEQLDPEVVKIFLENKVYLFIKN